MHIAIKLAVAITLLAPCACDVESESTDRLAQVDAINAQSCNTMSNQLLIELAMAQGGLSEDASMNEAFDEMTRRQEESVAAMVGLELSIADAIESDELAQTNFDTNLEVIQATARAEGSAVVIALDTAHGLLEAGERAMLLEALPEPSGPPMSEDGEMPPPPRHVQAIFDAI